MTHGKPCVTRHGKAKCMYDTWQAMCPRNAKENACVTHGKPCVHMHANGHAYKWGVHNHFVEEKAGKEKRKGEKERKGKEKRKREK